MLLSCFETFHSHSQPSLRHRSSLQQHQSRCVWWSHWCPDQLGPPGPRWAGGTDAWQCSLHWRWDWTWTVPLHLFQGTWYSTGWRLRTPPLTPPAWTGWRGSLEEGRNGVYNNVCYSKVIISKGTKSAKTVEGFWGWNLLSDLLSGKSFALMFSFKMMTFMDSFMRGTLSSMQHWTERNLNHQTERTHVMREGWVLLPWHAFAHAGQEQETYQMPFPYRVNIMNLIMQISCHLYIFTYLPIHFMYTQNHSHQSVVWSTLPLLHSQTGSSQSVWCCRVCLPAVPAHTPHLPL